MEEATMECPVCGCWVEVGSDQVIVACACCETIWVVAPDHAHLDRVLVGPEG